MWFNIFSLAGFRGLLNKKMGKNCDYKTKQERNKPQNHRAHNSDQLTEGQGRGLMFFLTSLRGLAGGYSQGALVHTVKAARGEPAP